METRRLNDVSPREWDKVRDKIAREAEEEAKSYQPIKPYKLPNDAKARKAIPVYTGFFKYFPRAIAEVARISLIGGIQHGQTPETLHWDRPKSGDELDALLRHKIGRAHV